MTEDPLGSKRNLELIDMETRASSGHSIVHRILKRLYHRRVECFERLERVQRPDYEGISILLRTLPDPLSMRKLFDYYYMALCAEVEIDKLEEELYEEYRNIVNERMELIGSSRRV